MNKILFTAFLMCSMGLVASCASLNTQIGGYFDRDGVSLLPRTISWGHYGTNYKIEGLLEDAEGIRVPVFVFATACHKSSGTLYTERASEEIWTDFLYATNIVSSPTVVRGGNTLPDLIFDQLCSEKEDEVYEYVGERKRKGYTY
jgi:hypothetical protein